MEQKLAYKDGDLVKETHVYSGPKGDGYIEYEYRMVDDVLEWKAVHTGPEDRIFPDGWTAVADTEEMQLVQTGTKKVDIDEVIDTIEDVDGDPKTTKKTKRVKVDVPVYSDEPQLVVVKHKYKKFFEVV